MIENKDETSRNLEKTLQALEQAEQHVANEKKKQNERKCKAEKPLPPQGNIPNAENESGAVQYNGKNSSIMDVATMYIFYHEKGVEPG